ncbi:alpha/beta hydrolase fold domain-containing protein [Microbacterium murale]|uniref:Esterase n=1 Tax=Microbacterium murale TaxID=1081040 RepID=A0ABQ1RGX2_9MICO|nr:alpha/beta hydrolase [Microbacterium murale]GGD69903.1 esterase [Microbacterium murale]
MIVPEALVPPFLRATRANAPFLSVDSARRAVRDAELRPQPYGPPPRLRSDLRVGVAHIDKVPVYTVAPARGATDGAVIYTHGGGWIHQIAKQHWELIAQIAVEANVTVVVPIYRLLPFGDAQGAHDLVIGIAEQLIERHGSVRLAGDSAGGQITLSVAQTLRDRGVPAVRTVLIAPGLDLTFSNPLIPVIQPTDPWLAQDGGRELGRIWAGELDVKDPIVSPLFGEFEGLGPMLVFSGTRDVLNPDAGILVDRARAAGVDVTFREKVGAVHVFPLLPTRSGRAARSEIVAALRG